MEQYISLNSDSHAEGILQEQRPQTIKQSHENGNRVKISEQEYRALEENDQNNYRKITDGLDKQFTFKSILKEIGIKSIPMILTYFSMLSIITWAIHLLKTQNNQVLVGAVGLGNSILNVFMVSLFFSLGIGLVSRLSHAYGRKDMEVYGVTLHRGFVINVILVIPLSIFLLNSHQIFILVGYSEELSYQTGLFLSDCIPGLIFFIFFNTLACYLNGAGMFVPPAICQIVSAAVYFVAAYVTMIPYEMGLLGCAIAFDVMQFMANLLLLIYIVVKNPIPGSLFKFRKDSFRRLWPLFKHEVTVGSMVFFSWIATEITALFGAKLPIDEFSGQVVVYNIQVLIYTIPYSISNIIISHMGSSLGEKNIKKAKVYLMAGLALVLFGCFCMEVLFLIFDEDILSFFTADEASTQYALEMIRVYRFLWPGDFLQLILCSGVRAIKKEKIGSIILFFAFYAFELPLCYFLCFTEDLGIKGIALGQVVVINSLFFIFSGFYNYVNWEKQVEIINEILTNEKEDLETPGLDDIQQC